jgi:HD superfamily phosphodiesterase/molybdopterin converting factor small subunit
MEFKDPRHEQIFGRALPHLQTRHNEVHTATSYEFARRLLAEEPGEEDVVLPAILLHDVGWSRVPEEQQLSAFGPNPTAPELTRVHEREGAAMAAEILRDLACAEDRVREIAAIIDGHDTRLTALEPSDALVKDADKLFRVSAEGFPIDCRRFGLHPAAHLAWLEDRVDRWFFSDTAKRIAREEIGSRRRDLEASAPGAGGGVRVRLTLAGFPDLTVRLGSETVEVEVRENTIGALVAWLQKTHGDAAGTRLLARDGHVDESVQILRNGEWIARDRMDCALAAGDEVTLLVLVAGG